MVCRGLEYSIKSYVIASVPREAISCGIDETVHLDLLTGTVRDLLSKSCRVANRARRRAPALAVPGSVVRLLPSSQ